MRSTSEILDFSFTLVNFCFQMVQVCLAKLKYAIANTEVMDADFVDRRGTTAWDALPVAPNTIVTTTETGAPATETVDAPVSNS